MRKIRWGIMSTAKIGTEKVIPAMQKGKYCEVAGIASRNLERSQAAAKHLGIPKAYGSYEDLLADPAIDAIYIPLPNPLHVPWSIKAIDRGKHVLCEKPLGMSVVETKMLLEASRKKPEIKVMEAFMYRHHPQWLQARQMVIDGKIGELRAIQSFFSFYNVDPGNIRNMVEMGGGALMDIGCYCISLSRFIFGTEPERVLGNIEYDPEFKVDRFASGVMDFGQGTATFTCGTQLAPSQWVNIIGTEGRVEIKIPFAAPLDEPSRIWHHRGSKIEEILTEEIFLEVCNHYTIQGDLFSLAVLNNTEVPIPLEDAVANMRVLEALVESAESGTWVSEY
jgi:predicted dehydrogenase